jgi:hypothetical protein
MFDQLLFAQTSQMAVNRLLARLQGQCEILHALKWIAQ